MATIHKSGAPLKSIVHILLY